MSKTEAQAVASDALLECPFCGYNEPILEVVTQANYCPNCGAVGPSDESAWGLSADQPGLPNMLWNRRNSNTEIRR